MPPADENVRVPVAVLNLFQLACPAALFGAVALGVPAVELNLQGSVTTTLFNSLVGGREVFFATIACTLLATLQLAAIRDPARATARYRCGIAIALLGVAAGLVVMHGAYRGGFEPFDYIESRPRAGCYLALFAGGAFSALAYLRLMRFLEPTREIPTPK